MMHAPITFPVWVIAVLVMLAYIGLDCIWSVFVHGSTPPPMPAHAPLMPWE
jgi:hypothetical protein